MDYSVFTYRLKNEYENQLKRGIIIDNTNNNRTIKKGFVYEFSKVSLDKIYTIINTLKIAHYILISTNNDPSYVLLINTENIEAYRQSELNTERLKKLSAILHQA